MAVKETHHWLADMLLADSAADAEFLASIRRPGRKSKQEAGKTASVVVRQEKPIGPDREPVGAFLHLEAEKNEALSVAQQVKPDRGEVFVEWEDSVFDIETGEELVRLMPVGRYNVFGQMQKAPGKYHTDELGYVLPLQTVHTHIFNVRRFEDESANPQTWLDIRWEAYQRRQGLIQPKPRKWMFEAKLSEPARRFLHLSQSRWILCERSGGWYRDRIEDDSVIKRSAELERAQVERCWERLWEVLSGRKEAPEVEPVEPETAQFRTAKSLLPESPTEEMDIYDLWLKGCKESDERRGKKIRIQAKTAPHEAEIARLQENLQPIVDRIKKLKRSRDGLAWLNDALMSKRKVIRILEDRAYKIRSDIWYEREAIRWHQEHTQ
ncbi:MAG: hypothetical protein JSU72_18025 [Deltaproteobacteria bacterium]|nr:MAG: hypothetical protein JSU72_18025 [Deltaproteobacteria bacterium]